MGGSHLDKKVNCKDTPHKSYHHSCSCQDLDADDDLCVRYFEELDIPFFDITADDEIDDGLELDELVTDLTIFHDVDENENIFDRNGPDDSESLSVEGLVSDGVSPLDQGKKLSDTTNNKSEDVINSNGSNNKKKKNDLQRTISALKGSRAKEGIIVESGRRVRWASDVYDPPITSDDHTLKNVVYRPRSKPIKKEYYNQKYKHSKSKTSQLGKCRSQHINRSNSQKIINQHMLRSQGRSEKAPMASLIVQKMRHTDANDKATTSEEETTLGSNFCRELVTSTVHASLHHLLRPPE